ncbi:Putative mitochondrial intermembrane space import and assembly protein [Septoria linicola]|uniref:Mitochondrial intermembrane space import and assembly protein 40 n=1 Tax=Septoria linicola TaxID=215465 RepID=A0A9Q9AIL1_9PEZI|nr:putative mitochondrial intermembrane space import and assembly protein [Septoria linicola]USW49957.1 Putative mitochondrial intermembrane space import and assembly protein [Septoria linicola]
MFRPVFRAATTARAVPQAHHIGRRFASTGASRPSSWKGAALRWTAAGTVVYYYNTSAVFAEEPQYAVHAAPETSRDSETHMSIDSIAEQRRAQARHNFQSSESRSDKQQTTEVQETVAAPDDEQTAAGGPQGLEEEAEQQGAFNEETGEINWDCPCLGGMAHGPCGEQFRAAFSCFVYSKEEPKGVECIDHFKTMQNCFREHPEIYGSELDDDEVAEVQAEEDRAQASLSQSSSAASPQEGAKSGTIQDVQSSSEPAKRTAEESSELVPKAAHDAR